MNPALFSFTNPKLVNREMEDADFLTVVNHILTKHGMSLADCDVEGHRISVNKRMPKEEEVQLAQEIADIVESEA